MRMPFEKRYFSSACLVGAILLVAIIGFSAKADLTGSSRIDILMEPIPCTLIEEIDLDTPCEKTLLKFDIESIINATLTVSGLALTLNSAMGIAGLEHFILVANATLGSVDIIAEVWTAAPFESVLDVNNMPNVALIPPGKLLFVKKRVTTIVNLGGVTIRNLAIYEDVTFPSPNADYGVIDCDGDGSPEGTCVHGVQTNPTTHYQTQSFAFGDLLTISGQTPSGVSIGTSLGICATNEANLVKKFSAPGSVNPECVSQPKPDILFDFITFSIGGIPIAPGVGASANITCIKISKCSLTNALSLSGGNGLPTFSLSFAFSDIFALTFGGVSLQFNLSEVNLNISINNMFQVTGFSLNFSKSVTTGDFNIRSVGVLTFVVGTGLTAFNLGVAVSRGTFTSNHALVLIRNPLTGGLEFGSLSISMGINNDPFRTSVLVVFGQQGLSRAGINFGLVF